MLSSNVPVDPIDSTDPWRLNPGTEIVELVDPIDSTDPWRLNPGTEIVELVDPVDSTDPWRLNPGTALVIELLLALLRSTPAGSSRALLLSHLSRSLSAAWPRPIGDRSGCIPMRTDKQTRACENRIRSMDLPGQDRTGQV
jgi:hypothetical protein